MQEKKLRPQDEAAVEAGPEAAREEEQAARQETVPDDEKDPLEALRAENAELRDRMLRVMAEMENLRKRTEREVRDAAQYAISSFARDILGVGDNMRRAFETVGEEGRTRDDPMIKGLLDGIEMTERELLNALERHGVKRIDPAGERFDPHLHQAMFEVDDASVAAGTVVQVLQAGFTINDRVLRPAMVAVSKGGAKAAPASSGDSADETDAPNGGNSEPGPRVDRTA